ncbi:MAG TPA: GNAT family N-acetyltransferase [Candidatus Acidoferrales bacterium]|nr:GNAT family N-acetyltransferase [Candidatus Acidoferrales bacterium]
MRLTLAEAVRLLRKSDAATAPVGFVSDRIEGAFVDSVREYPAYWHGNRLVLDRPPAPEEIERWREMHRDIFAWRDGAFPAVITWYDQLDVPPPEIADEVQTAMLAPGSIVDAPLPDGLRQTELATDESWDSAGDLACELFPHYGDFNRWRLATLRALAERGRGFYRALTDADGRVVASLGAFHADGVGRYANVVTAPAYRRRGCAAYLIASALRDLHKRVDDVVLVADTGSDAERLYRSLGFVPILSVRSIQR